jgi:uncharacterized membrane protein YphA (DoxX/SURF4 family)
MGNGQCCQTGELIKHPMKGSVTNEKMYSILRLGVAMCFIGHGAFGIITKAIWCNYFGVFGIGYETAYRLMPVVGTFDILFGISILVFPTRAVTLWLVIWGLITASLRPLSGEPFAEFIERAGNFGVPAALIILSGGFHNAGNNLFTKLRAPLLVDHETLKRLFSCLRITVFLLLLGHGWLNMLEKPGLINQYRALGLNQAVLMAHFLGVFEILSGVFILIFPYKPFLLAVFAWKMSTELFYPHYELFEWIERGGSYAAIISLWYCQELKPVHKLKKIFVSQQ